MVEINQVLSDEELKSKAAAIAAGVLVIIAGFLVYNYFSKVGKEEGVLKEGATVKEAVVEESTPAEGSTPEESTAESKEEIAPEKKPTSEKETAVAKEPSAVSAWTANNYKKGDISGSEYTVRRGDTLWEIAEARYGSGFEWGKILEANKDKIGFLPNGQQSLIIPGQVLVLP